MNYNITNYRNSTTECTGITNNATTKDDYIKTIVKHVKPDLITCNELGANAVNAQRLLDNALNVDGVNYWESANYSNNSFSSLVNAMFYNKLKFKLIKQVAIKKDITGLDLVRVLDIFTLIHLSNGLVPLDTVKLNVIVVHLKAGSTTADKTERAKMTEALMDYLTKNNQNENYVICGDFNVQSSNESSFVNLISPSNQNIRFIDPLDALGTWNNNKNYSNILTQSTRTTATNSGCFSGGGLDDRFDFILVSDEILKPNNNIKYIENTYKSIGNDGAHFDNEINSGTNTSVPKPVLDAIYGNSDHLPIELKLVFKTNTVGVFYEEKYQFRISYQNHNLMIWNDMSQEKPLQILLYNQLGHLVYSNSINRPSTEIEMSILPQGIYFCKIITEKGIFTKKINTISYN